MAEIQVFIELPDAIDPDQFYSALCEFGSYPEFADTVLSVTCSVLPGTGETLSKWRVKFREGILQWSEIDRFSPQNKTITFTLAEGDLDRFSGRWSVVAEPSRPRAVLFDASFDLGIPSLSYILDPLAIESLSDNVRRIVDGLCRKLADRARAGAPRVHAYQIGSAAC
jgi:hypothetical protein